MNSSGRLRCKMQVVKLAVFGVPPERDMRYFDIRTVGLRVLIVRYEHALQIWQLWYGLLYFRA